MITIRLLCPVFLFAYACIVAGVAIYLVLIVTRIVKSKVAKRTAHENVTEEDLANQPPLPARELNRRSQTGSALASAYVVVMAPLFVLAIVAAGAGHGTRIPMLIYAVLALPASLLALLRYALPPGGDCDVLLVLPLIVAPGVNAGLFILYRRLRRVRPRWRTATATHR